MNIHRGKIIEKVKSYKVIDCKHCGFVHQWPLPDRKSIQALYSQKYYQQVKPEYVKNMEKRDLDYRKFMACDVLDSLNRIRNTNNPGIILDIGCSTGIFLSVFRKAGWKTFGVEPYQNAALLAKKRGVRIIDEEIEKIDVEKYLNYFDFIYMREVIDHLLDPIQVLKNIYLMLKTNGVLCIETGNEFNPLQLAYIKKNRCKAWWITKDHINNFNKENLEKLLKVNRFKIKHSESTFPLEFFLFMGMDYRKNKSLGVKIHKFRKTFEMSLKEVGLDQLRKDLYKNFANLKIGRNIIVFAQK